MTFTKKWQNRFRRTVWYVDSVGGSDSNNGRSAASAFQTIAKLEAQTLKPGDGIQLQDGSVFHETLTVTVANLSIRGSGTGTQPLFDCSDRVAASAWSLTSGTKHVYQCTENTKADPVGSSWINVYENGRALVMATSVANCDARAGSYYIANQAVTPTTIYVHTAGSANPATDGNLYEYGSRLYGIYVPVVNGIQITGISGRRAIHSYGNFVSIYAGVRMNNCNWNDGNKHNMYVGQDAVIANTNCKNLYFGGQSATFFVHYTADANPLDVTYLNCSAQQLYGSSALVTGFYGHPATGANFRNVLFDACSTFGCDGGASSFGATATYNNCNFAVGSAEPLAAVNTFNGCTLGANSSLSLNAKVISNAAANTIIINACTLITTASFACAIYVIAGTSLSITGSTVTASGGYGIYATGALTLTSETNVFTCGLFNYTDSAGAISATSDYNRFIGTSKNFRSNNVVYTGLAAWKAATGEDLHSSTV